MGEVLQLGIVTGAAGLALAALVLPLVRRRSRPTGPGATCAKCTTQTRRRA